MKPRAVLFDIGSTLWSSPPEDAGALVYCYGRGREIIARETQEAPSVEALIEAVEGYFAVWEERWRQDRSLMNQPPTTEYVAKALREIGVTLTEPTLAGFTEAILETSAYTAKVEPAEPGMPEALADLSRLGLILACVSNAFMPASVLDWILAERGLKPYCRLTISSCDLGYRKPHPAIYEEALRRLDVTATETVFVGDRIDADIAGPAALGMGTVLTRQYREEPLDGSEVRPDHVIDHLRELPPYIERLLRNPD